METTHAAALAVIRQSIEMFREALRGLPDRAMDWTPAQGMSPFAVLVAHTCNSLRFFVAIGCGRPGSLQAYREGPRAASFDVHGTTVAKALTDLDQVERDLSDLLSGGTPSDLEAIIEWPEEPATVMTGTEALFRSVGHLREHVGHAQLTRDLWLAAHPS